MCSNDCARDNVSSNSSSKVEGTFKNQHSWVTFLLPFLKGNIWSDPIEGDLLLVPSGAIAIVLCSLLARFAVDWRVAIAELRFSLSIGIWPVALKAAPKIGILNRLFLATKWGKTGKVASKIINWKLTKNYVRTRRGSRLLPWENITMVLSLVSFGGSAYTKFKTPSIISHTLKSLMMLIPKSWKSPSVQ